MIVAIVTFQLPKPTTAEEMTASFQAAVPMFQSVAGLLAKYFYVSEDGRRAGGVYVWAYARGCGPTLQWGVEGVRREEVRFAAIDRLPQLAGDVRQYR